MRIVFVNRREMTLGWHEMRGLFWHPWFVGLVLVISAVIIVLRPYDDMVQLDAMEKTLFYANGVISFMACLIGGLGLAIRLERKVHSVTVLGFAVICASVWGLWFGTVLGAAPPTPFDYLLVSLFNLVFAFLGEIVFVSFMLDKVVRDIGPDPGKIVKGVVITSGSEKLFPAPAKPESAPMAVEILGRNFLQNEVWLLTAEEHYVSVGTNDGKSVLLRGNMSDAVSALPESLGLQVHRSFWVSRQSVDFLTRSGKGWRLRLHCGAEVPVARSRQPQVSAWMALDPKERAPRRVPHVANP